MFFYYVISGTVKVFVFLTSSLFKNSLQMRYHHFYLRKFCTMNYIHDSMVFLPFLLILCPLPLVGVGQLCLRYFRVQKRMDAFYKLLVKDSLDREDVEALEKEKAKGSYEVWQMFRDSNGIFHSYVAKSVIQLTVGTGIGAMLIWILVWGVTGEEVCDWPKHSKKDKGNEET